MIGKSIMMEARMFSVALMLASSILASSPANAENALDQAWQLPNGNQAEATYQVLAQDYEQRAGQPDYDLLFGTAAVHSGRLFDGAFALERVLAGQPDNIPARFGLGRAYYEMGFASAATQEFTRLRALPIPQAMAQEIDKYMSVIAASRAVGRSLGANVDATMSSAERQQRERYLGTPPLWQVTTAAFIGRVVFASPGSTATGKDEARRILRSGDHVFVGDRLTTGGDGFLHVAFADGGFIALQPDSAYRIEQYLWSGPSGNAADSAVYRLERGGIRGITGAIGRSKDAYSLITAVGTIAVGGYGFNTRICNADCGDHPDGLVYKTWEGTPHVKTNVQQVTFPNGTSFYLKDLDTPVEVQGAPPGYDRGANG